MISGTAASTLSGACGPPMLVFNHPGCKLMANMFLSFRSQLIDLVAAFNAA